MRMSQFYGRWFYQKMEGIKLDSHLLILSFLRRQEPSFSYSLSTTSRKIDRSDVAIQLKASIHSPLRLSPLSSPRRWGTRLVRKRMEALNWIATSDLSIFLEVTRGGGLPRRKLFAMMRGATTLYSRRRTMINLERLIALKTCILRY